MVVDSLITQAFWYGCQAAENESSSPSYGVHVVGSALPVSPDIEGKFLLFSGLPQAKFAFFFHVLFEDSQRLLITG